jgi:hypothetical protein
MRGQRLEAKAPYGHWKTMTFLAALRHDRIDAPWVVDGPINGELFRLYAEKVLVPTLKPGDIVIPAPPLSAMHSTPAFSRAARRSALLPV